MTTQIEAVDEDGCNSPDYLPFLTAAARSTSARRKLRVLVELSFVAGAECEVQEHWQADMRAALEGLFPSIRPERREAVEALLTAAYYAGDANAAVTWAARPERALQVAQARTTLHEVDCDSAGDRHHSAHEREARSTAYYLARKLPIGADEAAACTMQALWTAGFPLHFLAVEGVLEASARGVKEREDWEASNREFRNREDSALASLLGEALA